METMQSVPPPAQTASNDERMWAMLCHISSFAGFIIPFGNVIGPLIIWSMKRAEFPLVDDQGKEALNFQISMTIFLIVSAILILVLIGIVFLVILGVFDLIITIIAAVRANSGERFRYPLSIRFVK
jgi:uncharacterized Tic20 family protein